MVIVEAVEVVVTVEVVTVVIEAFLVSIRPAGPAGALGPCWAEIEELQITFKK